MRLRSIFCCVFVCAVLVTAVGGQSVASGPRIVSADSILHDEMPKVRIEGMNGGSTYGVRTEFCSRSGTIWRSEVQFVVDASGIVDLTAMAPVSGSYTVSDPLGPFWSMENSKERSTDASLFDNDDQSTVTIQVREGEKIVVQKSIALMHRQIGISTTEIRTGGVVGTFFSPPVTVKMPGVIVLGGSEGGLPRPYAALIASHGFRTLALGYFGMPGLPADLERVPIETVDRGVEWLAKQPGVDAGRIMVVGGSKGAELALLAASRNPRIRAVVAYAPSSTVYEGISQGKVPVSSWTDGGVDLPFVPYVRSEAYTKSRRLIDLYDPTYAAAKPETKIPVENIAGPVMLISGKSDALWPSSKMADEIAQRLAKRGFKHALKNVQFEEVGHHVGSIPLRPTADSVRLGGTARSIAKAQIEVWRQMIEFMRSVGK